MIPSPFSSFLDLYCGAPAKGLRDKPSAYRSLGVNLLADGQTLSLGTILCPKEHREEEIRA